MLNSKNNSKMIKDSIDIEIQNSNLNSRTDNNKKRYRNKFMIPTIENDESFLNTDLCNYSINISTEKERFTGKTERKKNKSVAPLSNETTLKNKISLINPLFDEAFKIHEKDI